MGLGGQRHAPADLLPGMTRYPLCRRLGGPQGRCGGVRKVSPPPGFDFQTIQPVAALPRPQVMPTPGFEIIYLNRQRSA